MDVTENRTVIAAFPRVQNRRGTRGSSILGKTDKLAGVHKYREHLPRRTLSSATAPGQIGHFVGIIALKFAVSHFNVYDMRHTETL